MEPPAVQAITRCAEIQAQAAVQGWQITPLRGPACQFAAEYAVAQGNKHAYECEASSYDAPIAPELIAACKSLTPTD